MADDKIELAFNLYNEGKNIFITGPGGTGKSTLLRKIVTHAKIEKGLEESQIAITAMTGCAAILLECGASTIHSWAKIGICNMCDSRIIGAIDTNKTKRAIWRKVKILIIDEVSMMSARLFNLLVKIARQTRGINDKFGGIQLILCGDFYQLPPIYNSDNGRHLTDVERDTSSRFAFESEYWNQVLDNTVVLTETFRYTDDAYSRMLNKLRLGEISKKNCAKLQECVDKLNNINTYLWQDNIIPTLIFPKKRQVDEINKAEYNKLSGTDIVYDINKHYNLEVNRYKYKDMLNPSRTEIEYEIEFLIKNSLFEKRVELKVGCQVMSIINIKDPISESIIICNGSRGIIIGFRENDNIPIVKFENGLIIEMQRSTCMSDKYPQLGISQIPLILCWAISIHKGQGITLDTAIIDIGSDIFAPGQAYVALSRVKSYAGLYLKAFDYTKIKTDIKVAEYYKLLI